MSQLLIYRRPAALSHAQHHDLRVSLDAQNFDFASALNSVPLAVAEFARAASHYPIVFAGDEPGAVVPAALLGLGASENLFVDAQGHWQTDTYIPAFLRRYPFGLAEKAESKDFTVCLDQDYPGVGADDGEPLFDADGGHAPLLQRAVDFLREYQGHMDRTAKFSEAVRELELLQPKIIRVESAKVPAFTLKGFYVIDEERLRALKPTVLKRLVKSGDLGWIYVHLMSLANVERLSRRLDRRKPGTH